MTPEPTRANDEVLRRVQGEFLEMPGLRLTEPQARRLWGLDAASCDALLGALVEAKFLFRTRDGAFMRVEHAAPVKASLRSRRLAGAAQRHNSLGRAAPARRLDASLSFEPSASRPNHLPIPPGGRPSGRRPRPNLERQHSTRNSLSPQTLLVRAHRFPR